MDTTIRPSSLLRTQPGHSNLLAAWGTDLDRYITNLNACFTDTVRCQKVCSILLKTPIFQDDIINEQCMNLFSKMT